MKPAAVYLRVSTADQTIENQREAVERLCRARGFEPVVYEESGSATKARPVFESMMHDAKTGKVRGVFVWALDRLGRSMAQLVTDVGTLKRLGVRVASVKEDWLDADGPHAELLLGIFAWVAQFEKSRLVERTHAGIARAREKGTRSGLAIGRPRTPPGKLALAVEAVGDRRFSIAKAARTVGVGPTTLRRELQRLGFRRVSVNASGGIRYAKPETARS